MDSEEKVRDPSVFHSMLNCSILSAKDMSGVHGGSVVMLMCLVSGWGISEKCLVCRTFYLSVIDL